MHLENKISSTLGLSLKAFWLLVLLFGLNQSSYARTYQVELLIFSNEASESAEQWDFASEATLTQLAQHNQSKPRAAAINNPRTLTVLAGARNQIANSGRHRILQALSWTQSSASYANSPLVEIDNPGNQLDGTVRVYAPNLLFSELNLRYHPNTISPPQFALMEIEQYFLQEKRRLKLKETHYFDHPKFGAILSVRPIETITE